MLKWLMSLWVSLFVSLYAGADNRILVCDNSLEAFKWAKLFIAKAEQSIEFSPCLTGGVLLNEMLEALEARLEERPQLKVSLLLNTAFLEPENIKYLQKLSQSYSKRMQIIYTVSVLTLEKDISFIDNHIKMIIVDERYFVTGGSNYDYVIATEGTQPEPRRVKPVLVGSQLPNGARDQDIVGMGETATNLRKLYYQLCVIWKSYHLNKRFISTKLDGQLPGSEYWPLDQARCAVVEEFDQEESVINISKDHIRVITGGPSNSHNPITDHYCSLIDKAQDEILIANLYFTPSERLLKSLMAAARRGVKITIITNGTNDRSPGYTKIWACANRVCYLPVLYGKKFNLFEKQKCNKEKKYSTDIYEYYVDQILFHKKVMIVDQKHFVIGSYNLGLRSDLGDFELIVSMNSVEACRQALAVYQKDLKHSIKLTEQQIRNWYFDPWLAYQANLQRRLHVLI